MEELYVPILEVVILLVFLIICANIISHFIPKIPVSIVQIILGASAALMFHTEIKLETDWFLLLFIAPLLFNDAWTFPKKELWELRGPIFGNAILLVLLTTILGGWLIYLIVPAIPLPVAFALAAILSPTDPVAVQSIGNSVSLPARIMHLVAGESLINDASGLVAFRFAITATVTGAFSITQIPWIGLEMVRLIIVGIVVGLVFMQLINLVIDNLRRKGIDDAIFHVVVQLITPFLIFFIAEEVFNASGVIAVVAAGILANVHSTKSIEETPELTLIGINTWKIVSYLLNGMLFVILGIELPVATHISTGAAQFNIFEVVGYAVVIWMILFIIRVLWTYVSQWTHHFKKNTHEAVSWRVAILSGLTGVRGSITMAGVLSIPSTLKNGAGFPARELTIALAAVTILLSLLMAVVVLPWVTQKKIIIDEETQTIKALYDEGKALAPYYISEPTARIITLQMAVRTLENLRREGNQGIIYDLILEYQFLIRKIQLKYQADSLVAPVIEDEIELRKKGLMIERDCLQKLLINEKISQLVYHSGIRRIERQENELENYMHRQITFSSRWIEYAIRRFFRFIRIWLSGDDTEELQSQYELARRETAKAAIKGLSDYLSVKEAAHVYDHQAVYNLIIQYRSRIEKIKQDNDAENRDAMQEKAEILAVALTAQREGVAQLYAQHQISRKTAVQLRQHINYAENAAFNHSSEEL